MSNDPLNLSNISFNESPSPINQTAAVITKDHSEEAKESPNESLN